MKLLAVFLLSLMTVAADEYHAYFIPPLREFVFQRYMHEIEGYSVQYDAQNDMVMFMNDDNCFVVQRTIRIEWLSFIVDEDDFENFLNTVMQQIHTGVGVYSLTHQQAYDGYGSYTQYSQCLTRDVFRLMFAPPISQP